MGFYSQIPNRILLFIVLQKCRNIWQILAPEISYEMVC